MPVSFMPFVAGRINPAASRVPANVGVLVNLAVFESDRQRATDIDSCSVDRLIPHDFTMPDDRRGVVDSYATVDRVLYDAMRQLAFRCTAAEMDTLPVRGIVSGGEHDSLASRADSSQPAEYLDLEVSTRFDTHPTFDDHVL